MKVNSGADSKITIPTSGTGYNYDLRVQGGQAWYGLIGNHTINFPSANTDYFIEISGEFPHIYINNNSEKLKFLDVVQVGDIKGKSFNRSFYGASNLTWSATDVPNLISVTDMQQMFRLCTSLPTLDVSNWDVSNVTNMNAMFYDCTSLPALDVSNWDVSSVTNMGNMFNNCTSLPTLDTSQWDVSSVTNMAYMFYNAKYELISEIDFSDPLKGSINVTNILGFCGYNSSSGTGVQVRIPKVNMQAGNVVIQATQWTTYLRSFLSPHITNLELIGLKVSWVINYMTGLTGSAIDDFFDALDSVSSGESITISTSQNTSGIDTTIATLKGWTIVIV